MTTEDQARRERDNYLAFVGFAQFLVIIGIGCAAYEYVPFYGATPITVGGLIVLQHYLGEWRSRRSAGRP